MPLQTKREQQDEVTKRVAVNVENTLEIWHFCLKFWAAAIFIFSVDF